MRMSGGGPKAPILPTHTRFDETVQAQQCAQVINGMGRGTMHMIVSAEPGVLSASRLVSSAIPVTCLTKFPPLSGLPSPGRFKRIAEAMKGHGLVLTYGWGAIDAVLAHTLFSEALGLPPLIHHETGLDGVPAAERGRWRRWVRQIALGRTEGLVVSSRAMQEFAIGTWQQPSNRVHRIDPGIDFAAFEKPPRADVLPQLVKHADEFWIGSCIAPGSADGLLSLLRSFIRTADEWQLVLLGEEADRARIDSEVERLGIEHRVHWAGSTASHADVFGLFDIYVAVSGKGQSALPVIEAMAAGLPVVGQRAGATADHLASANAPYIVPSGDKGAFSDALFALAESGDLRRQLGKANCDKAREKFAQERMVERYRTLYAAAIERVRAN